MKNTLKAAAFSACALFLVAGSSAAASPGEFSGGGWEPGARLMQLVKRANLTSQQEAQIQNIRAAARSQEKQFRTQWVALHQQMADKLLSSGTPALADFSSLTQQMEQLHSQQVTLGLQTALQIRAVLTPAQVTHVAQIHQQLSNLNSQRQAVLQDDDVTDLPVQQTPQAPIETR